MTDKTSSAKTTRSATARATQQAKANERPLVEDIRLLGRILGDVIREQEGREAYELVEQVRKLSVAFRRDADTNADKSLKKLLASLSAEATVSDSCLHLLQPLGQLGRRPSPHSSSRHS